MPVRLAPILFGLIISAVMSGGATRRKADPGDGFFEIWIKAWLPSWLIAVLAGLVVAPIARLVGLLVKRPAKLAR